MPMRREDVAAALKYLGEKADLRGRVERAISLDPQEQDLADLAVETGASFIPGVGPALAARDVERARRANDPAGMALAASGAIPGGKMVRAIKMAGETKPQKIAQALEAVDDFRMSHRPMGDVGGASRLHDAYKSFGEDIYGPNALQYFGSGDPRERKIVAAFKRLRDNPEAEVTIYRGVPKDAIGDISTGDWVTLDRSVAQEYGPKVLAKKVKAKDVTTWPDALLEFGFYPKD